MKRITKLLSLILSFMMLLCFLPHSVLAQIGEVFASEETAALTELPAAEAAGSADTADVYVLGEVTDKRTETAKTFRMSDGSYVAADYGKPVHFEDVNSEWRDYDNTLAFSDAVTYDTEDFAGYAITDSDISVKLANNSNSNNLLKITKGAYKISLHLVDAQKSKAIEIYPAEEEPTGNDLDSASTLHKFSSGAIYKDILPSADLEYIIRGNSVKENIIVKEKSDSYVYTFELKLHGLVPVLQSDGSVALNDGETDEAVLVIPKGYMYDANGESSNAVTYAVAHKNGKKYTLTVTADSQWINAETRAFPVTVDPTVTGFRNGKDTYDTQISEANPAVNYYNEKYMHVGYDASDVTKQNHILIRAQSLPELPESAVVVSAVTEMRVRNVVSGGAAVCAYPVTGAWESETVKWESRPADSGTVLDYAVLNTAPENNYVYWDVTRAAQAWYTDETRHYGIVLKPMPGSGSGYVEFYSSDSAAKPLLCITYRDTKGIEGIWTYSAQSGGSAGAGYVNGFNGSLVLVHNDMTTKGGILPVTVSHVYNSSLAGLQFTGNEGNINAPVTADYGAMSAGFGWKLSVQETIVPKIIDESTYYVYNDSDGTEHYYYFDTTLNKYIDEDGTGLELAVGSDGDEKYTITDEYGNKKCFGTNGYVTKITDVHGNKKEYNYSTSNRLASVASATGNQPAETQLTFTYNTSGALTRITDGYDTDKYISYYYSTGATGMYSADYAGYLRRIEYFNNGQSLGYSTYNYNANGLLTDTYDSISGFRLAYSYTVFNGNMRVSSVTESSGTATGQTVGYEYGDKLFSVRTSGNDDAYGTSDDLLTVCVFDDCGKAICAYSSNLSGDEIYGASYAEYTVPEAGKETNNRIKTSAVKGITRQNYFADGSLENASGWSKDTLGSGSASYTGECTLFGSKAMKLTATDSDGHAMYYRFFNIPEAGTYTVSAYVKTVNVTGEGGLTLGFNYTSSEAVTGTTNTAINNGWRRISITKTFASAGSYSIDACLENASGTAYVDCIQLEKSETPSDFNFVDNGGMEAVRKWTGTYTLASGKVGAYGAQLTGAPAAQNRISQTINVNAPIDTTFMLSGWAKAESVGLAGENRKFGLLAVLTYSDNTSEEHYLSFNADNVNWQYATLAIVPQSKNTALTVATVELSACYDYNANTAVFDDIALTVEPSQTYSYDEEGNLTSAADAERNESLLAYAENGVDLQSYTTPANESYNYTYIKDASGNDTHLVDTVTRSSGGVVQTMDYGYNGFGSVVSTVLSANGTGEIITSSAEYSTDGNYLTTAINQLGKATSYNYENITKLLSYVEHANSVRTAYVYDEFERTSRIYLDADEDGIADTAEAQVSYLYASGRLSGIDTATTDYSLTYDAFGNILAVKAGNNTLATYEYAANNGKLKKLTYGNGDYEEYFYDTLDRLVQVKFNGVVEYTLLYDANGRLYSVTEGNTTHIYEYDSLDRLIRAWQKDANANTVVAVENTYDELGRAKGSTYVAGDRTMEYSVTYKTDSSLVSSLRMPDASENSLMSAVNYTYDKFDRLTTKEISMSSMSFLYEDYAYYTYTGSDNKTHTTSLVSSVTLSILKNGTTTSTVYSYTYDNLGNIKTVRKDGTYLYGYTYDSLGQLVSENDNANSLLYSYTYDNAGNITKKTVFDTVTSETTDTILYTYSDSAWGDLLTNYDGTAINYDAIGNPTNWRNASSLTWNGRELSGLTLSNEDSFTYTYNSDGIRTQKKYYDYDYCGYYTYDYVLDGTRIISETAHRDSTKLYTLYYLYDESGSVVGFIYNNAYYYFQKNLQGDVVRILDYAGNVVVEYTYDAWGKVLSVTGSHASTIGKYNPFRYRSYYYDVETGFYYLQSRYYDPVVGRFLNADGIVGANGGIVGYNMFAYCNNNPVMYCDPSGCMSVATIRIIYRYLKELFERLAITYNFSGQFMSNGVTNYADALKMASDVATHRLNGNDDTILYAYELGGPDYGEYGPGSSVKISYNATIFVIEGDKITNAFKASTLPQFTVSKEYSSKGGVATLMNGKYGYVFCEKYAHKTNVYHVRNYGTSDGLVPCVRWDKNSGQFIESTATGILIHDGTVNSRFNNPTSMGCIIVEGSWSEFYQFVGTSSGTLFVYGPNRYD